MLKSTAYFFWPTLYFSWACVMFLLSYSNAKKLFKSSVFSRVMMSNVLSPFFSVHSVYTYTDNDTDMYRIYRRNSVHKTAKWAVDGATQHAQYKREYITWRSPSSRLINSTRTVVGAIPLVCDCHAVRTALTPAALTANIALIIAGTATSHTAARLCTRTTMCFFLSAAHYCSTISAVCIPPTVSDTQGC